MKTVSFKDLEKLILEASKQKEHPFVFTIRGTKESVRQWVEMFDKEIREQCGKI